MDLISVIQQLEMALRTCDTDSKASMLIYVDLAKVYLERHEAQGLPEYLEDAIATI